MKILSRTEFTRNLSRKWKFHYETGNWWIFLRLSMASLIVSCIMLAPLLGSLICVMCLLNDPPEAPPEDYYGPIDHGLQRFKRFYGRHIVWYRVSWLLIFILGVWAFRNRLKSQTVVSVILFWDIEPLLMMIITIAKSRRIDCSVLPQNYAYRMHNYWPFFLIVDRSHIRLSDINSFWSPGIMVGPLVLNGLRNSSIVSLQAGLVLSWFLKSTDKHFMSSYRILIIFIYSGISKFYDLQILDSKNMFI